jgi:two-component system, response regulator FlrC
MRLLIVGTLGGQLGAASKIAMDRGAKVAHTSSVEAAMEALRSGQSVDLIMVEVECGVRDLVDQLSAERIHCEVVACGVSTDARAAAGAIRDGAKEFIPLPPDPDLIAAVLEAAADESHAFIFRDPVMQRVVDLADQVAASEANILITGQSGSGKEVLARHLHRKSKRADRAFISINCAAIPENLLESELFGHEKGAFTGAVARRIGKFEEADGGTLLLDEVSEMDPRLQAKLLRALQEREIDRVGGSKPVKVNIRVIATSNRDLASEVAEGNFREDLLYRLNVINLEIPPLDQRPADVIPLAEHFASKYAEVNGVPDRPLSEAACEYLVGAHWKGNVRELENAMHRAILLTAGEQIGPEAFDHTGGSGAATSDADPSSRAAAKSDEASVAAQGLVGLTVAEVERDLIIQTLDHCLGNRTHAANILGISIRTLRNKLKLYGGDGVSVPYPGERGPAPTAGGVG